MAVTVYKKTGLTGGTAGMLDSIDGDLLLDGDYAFTHVSNVNYVHLLDDDIGGAENSPYKINPDTNPGSKRWILQGLVLTPLAIGHTIAGGTTPKTLTVTADTALDEAVAMSSKAPKASPVFTGPITDATLPAFLAWADAQLNITGDGTAYPVVFAHEIFDQSGDFNVATGVFTAPITGRYRFTTSLYMYSLAAANTAQDVSLMTSNRTIVLFSVSYGSNPLNEITIGGSVLTDMDAADTVYVQLTVGGETKIVDIAGTTLRSYFCGELVC